MTDRMYHGRIAVAFFAYAAVGYFCAVAGLLEVYLIGSIFGALLAYSVLAD